MTYRELKTQIGTLTEAQLNKEVILYTTATGLSVVGYNRETPSVTFTARSDFQVADEKD